MPASPHAPAGTLRGLPAHHAELETGDVAAAAAAADRRALGRAPTPQYAGPGPRRGEPVGTAGDLYALGVTARALPGGKRSCAPFAACVPAGLRCGLRMSR